MIRASRSQSDTGREPSSAGGAAQRAAGAGLCPARFLRPQATPDRGQRKARQSLTKTHVHPRIAGCPEALPTERDASAKWRDKEQAHPELHPVSRLTLLSLETARDTEVLNSSGFFCAKVVMRLVAAVTTP